MVERLKTCLTSYAVTALVNGIVHIAFDFFGTTLHDPNDDTFASGTLAAHRGIPVIQTGDEVLRHLNGSLDQQLICRNATCLKHHRTCGGATNNG